MRRCVFAVLAVAAGLGGCGRAQKPPALPMAAVDVVTLHAGRVALETELPGRVSAHRVAEIRPQVSGVILRRLFTEGDFVKAGQALYQIDPKPYEASLASARASAAKARAAVVAARLTVKRYQPLARAFAVSGQDLDNAVAALAQDEADVASADAAVKTAEINLAYTHLDSPISGRTGRSLVTEGALVTQNQSDSLVTVTELDPIYVDVSETAATLLRMKREMAAGQMALPGGAAVSLTLDDGSAYGVAGRLLFSEVTVDAATGSVTLRAEFSNADGLLLPGMFVREKIAEGTRENAILVPQRGVTHDAFGHATALVVGADHRVVARVVTTERAVGANWLVTAGLAAGDRVIVSGLQQARPGAQVVAREVTIDGATLKPVQQAALSTTGVH